MNNYKSRKLWFAALVFLVTSLLLVLGYLPATDYAAITIATIGGYMVGNVGDKWVQK